MRSQARAAMALSACVGLTALVLPATAGPPLGRAATPPPAQDVLTVAYEFVPAETTMARGGRLVLTNLEPAPHDITSTVRSKGKPLFRSATISAGGSAEVIGVATLRPGAYTFICSVHPAMRGVLEITRP